MTPTRLLMTVDAVGGVWSYALDLAAALTPLGYETVLALIGPPASATQRDAVARLPGVSLVSTGLDLDWLAADDAAVGETGRALAALALKHDAHLVQLNQPAFAASAHFPVPVVAVAHSCVGTWWDAVYGTAPLPADLAWQAEAFGRGVKAADAAICPSHAFADALTARYGLTRAPAVVHNGRTAVTGTRSAMHDFAFTAGRLWDTGKNVATLDRAAARLGIPFKAAGALQGPHGEAITLAHLQASGVLEPQALARCLSARPVFVSAARYEPFGLAVLEAALAGCPLVLSDIATFREIWGDAAIFVDPDDDIGFARAIEALVGDAGARLARGDEARRRAARYTPAQMARDMAAVYQGVMRGMPAAGVAAA